MDRLSASSQLKKRTIHQPDALADPKFTNFERQQRSRARTRLGVPLLHAGKVIGVIFLARYAVRPFSGRQIDLVTTFAEQAVIAIENTRLFEEVQARTADLQESLEQQTATGEILASISASMTNPQPVFDAIVRNVNRLFGTQFANVQLLRDGIVHMPASGGEPRAEELARHYPRPLDHATVGGQAMLTKQVAQYSLDNGAVAPSATQVFARGFVISSVLAAPMIHNGKVIGAIGAAREAKPFDDKEVALIKAFADQAVIAIENTRLFEAEQASKRELQESLEYQTATSEVLEVISRSPTDANPVFDSIAQSAANLCSAKFCHVFRFDGDLIHYAASNNSSLEQISRIRDRYPIAPGRASAAARCILTASVVEIPDVQLDPEYEHGQAANVVDFRSILAVPMIKDDRPIGAIVMLRSDPGRFQDRQIELLKTFADQAVIAIENTRLFEAEQASKRELQESLEQQTATADVLKVISRSAL